MYVWLVAARCIYWPTVYERKGKNMSQQRTGQEGRQGSSLQSDRGSTSISDSVVQKIAGIAAQEVEKVQMGGGTAAAVTGFLGSVSSAVTGSSAGGGPTTGVSVEVGQEGAGRDVAGAGEERAHGPRSTR